MGKSKGKGKKQIVINNQIDGNAAKEKILPNRKRGRPAKLVRDEFVEEPETETIREIKENGEHKQYSILSEGAKIAKESDDETKIGDDFSVKSIGFRQIGSRRKNKPRRAALIGVECI